MRRALLVLAVALTAALPAHAGNADHVMGTASHLTGYDTVNYEDDWRSHPFDVSLSLDAVLLTGARTLGPAVALGTISLTIALDGVEETVEARVWQGGTIVDEHGRRVVLVHAQGLDGCQYSVTIWGLTDALVQIDRGGGTCSAYPAHIDATGQSSFALEEIA